MSSRSPAPGSPSRLSDELLERYVCWREACDDVRAAYENWRDGEPADREGAFLAYGAALDREESAAWHYHKITQCFAPRALPLTPG